MRYRIPILLALALSPARLVAQAPVAGDTLTLDAIYAQVEANNPMLRAAEAGVRAAAAQERSAGLPPDPQLRLGVMNASLPSLRGDMPTSMAPAVELMQMVPLPGKLGLMGSIAGQTTAIRSAEAQEVGWEVRARAAMAAYEIYSVDRQVAVMRETVELLRGFEQVARAMYASGEGRQSDVLLASVEVARMEAEIVRMQAMRDGAVGQLNAVLGREVGRPVDTLLPPEELVSLPDAATLARWAEETRPMLERDRIVVDQAANRESLARRELWPDLTVGIQYGQRSGEMGTEHMGSLMLGVSLPVFARSRQLRMREEAGAMREMAAADLADARARVHARITSLRADAERARTLIELYRAEVLPQANATVASAMSAYRVGSVDFMTLIDAQMNVNRFEQEMVVLIADYGRTLAELEMEIGRGLTRDHIVATEER